MRKLWGFAFLLMTSLALGQSAYYQPPNPIPGGGFGAGFWASSKTSYLAASTSSASIALGANTGQVQIFNSTTGIAFCTFSPTSSPIASVGASNTVTSDYPVAPGSVVVVTVPANAIYAACILSASSGAIYLTAGVGL